MQAAHAAPGGIPAASPLSEQDRREIYLALCAALPLEEKLHMARVSLVLNESGHTKERYGFQKMKELLRCLTDFLTLDDAVMGGVPQTLITIHEMCIRDRFNTCPLPRRAAAARCAALPPAQGVPDGRQTC